MAVIRMRRARTAAFALAAAGALVGALSFGSEGALAEVAGWLALTWAAWLLVIGPQWVRNDLRGDLLKLDLLRSYPLRGRTVVVAETTASTLVLSAVQLSLLGVAYLAFLGEGGMEVDLVERTVIFVAAIVYLPATNFAGMLIQNAAALLYPTWVHLGANRPGGIEALGQNMLVTVAFAGALALALAVPVALGGGTFLLLDRGLGLWALLPASAVGLGTLALEAGLAIEWLGKVFERTDAAAVGVPL
jgi:hypothetical protein